jgi:hypothetical protein
LQLNLSSAMPGRNTAPIPIVDGNGFYSSVWMIVESVGQRPRQLPRDRSDPAAVRADPSWKEILRKLRPIPRNTPNPVQPQLTTRR